jgi:hypothetical protein
MKKMRIEDYPTFDEHYQELKDKGFITEEDEREIELQVMLIGEQIKAREEREQLKSKKTATKKESEPTLVSFLQKLEPLGKTLEIVPIDDRASV